MKNSIILLLSSLTLFFTVSSSAFTDKIVISGMDRPWAVVSGPDGNIWITEKRTGKIYIYNTKFVRQRTVQGPANMSPYGEGGLMDLAFHPKFAENHWLFLSYSVKQNGKYKTQIGRFTYSNGELTKQKVLLDGPLSDTGNHFGSRLIFDDQGYLLASFGERLEKEKAQDLNQMNGKIIRITDDGAIPKNNPFRNSFVYTLGNRNPQGLAIHPLSRRLYESEHGPSTFDAPPGGDEINEIIAAGNYGWPKYHHRENGPGMIAPILEYTPAIAPSGIIFYIGSVLPEWKNDLFVACLKGQQVLRVRIDAQGVFGETEVLLKNKYGRLRDVETSPDGSLLVLAEQGNLIQLK